MMRLNPNKKEITLEVHRADIMRGECANRRQCVVAQAIDRQFGLKGRGYIRVDANEIGVTFEGNRYRFHPRRTMMTYLRRFDRIGEQKGLDAAREAMDPTKFTLKLLSVRTIPPKASRERMDQVNKARRSRNAEAKARGTYQPSQPRYVGT